MKIQEGMVEISGLQYAYKAWGDPKLPVMLAFHGWLDNANSFDCVAPTLAKSYRFIAIDFLGHGKSDWLPERCFYHYTELLVDASELLMLWGAAQPVTLMGHSLGGAVAVCLAALFPEAVKACITLDAVGPWVTEVENLVEKMAMAVQFRRNWEPRAARVFSDFEAAVRVRQVGEWAITPTAARQLCERGLRAVEGGWVWRADPRWKTPSVMRLCEAQVRAILQAIRCPVLLAVSDQGLVHSMPSAMERKACFRDLTECAFRGGHHFHMEEDAPLLCQWVLTELEKRA
ncbi:MAG: alpha/beta hydrolase [Gammaproteobacteria bacterium]